MAEASLTPNRAAAALRLIPPRTTASITRSRKSCEYAEAISAGLRPAGRLNQNNADSGIPPRFKLDAARSNVLQEAPTRRTDLGPGEGLGCRVDLIVMASGGEHGELGDVVRKPMGL